MLHFCFIRDKKTLFSEFLSNLHFFQGEGGEAAGKKKERGEHS